MAERTTQGVEQAGTPNATQAGGGQAPGQAQAAEPKPTGGADPDSQADSPAHTAGIPEGITPQVIAAVEAVLFSADKPIAPARVAEALAPLFTNAEPGEADPAEPITPQTVEAIARALNERYDAGQHAFRIEHVAGGLRVMTRPEHAAAVAAFHRTRSTGRLSRPAMETLAIVAYRQPITRAELESIRGVACGEVLRSLLERKLIAITGRAEELGRPMLYGTTRQFLDLFGLASLKDLPGAGELQEPPGRVEASAAARPAVNPAAPAQASQSGDAAEQSQPTWPGNADAPESTERNAANGHNEPPAGEEPSS